MHHRQSRAPFSFAPRHASRPPFLQHCSFVERHWTPPPAHDRTLIRHRHDAYHRRLQRIALMLAAACIGMIAASISFVYIAWFFLSPYLAHIL